MKVAIVGAYNHKNSDAPFDDPSWEIWTIGKLAGKLPRVTRVYEVHAPEVYRLYKSAMEGTGARVYYRDDLPIDEWADKYGNLKNSVTIIMCHALEEGADTVALYNAPHVGEPTNVQRSSAVYWFGLLRGAGIDVRDHTRLIEWEGVYGRTI